MDSDHDDGLVSAFALDGTGGGAELDWTAIRNAGGDTGVLWIHLSLESPRARQWLVDESGVDPIVVEALISDETRPRATLFGAGLLLNLRGVNLNPGSNPEDMVAIRCWIDGNRIISVRRRRLMAVDDIRQAIRLNAGPPGPGAFVTMLAEKLVERMAGVISELDDRVDALEDTLLEAQSYDLRRGLNETRRQAIALRRYIGPNREALTRVIGDGPGWLDQRDRQRLREVSDRITRYLEDLDSARERAAVIQDELATRLAETMNRNTYLLSIVAAVFLPLGLLTGLLGINVAGIPGEKWGWAFTAVCILLVVLAVAELVYLRWRRWL